MLCQVYNTVTAEYLPVYVPNELERSNPAIFAENVRNVMATAMGAKITNHDLSDTLLLRRASKTSRQYIAKHLIPTVETNVLKHICELNYDNIEALVHRFKAVDTKDTGRINFEQFCQVMETNTNSRYAETLFGLLQHADGHYIDFKDLCFGLSLISNDSKKHEKYRIAFAIYDSKGSGCLEEDDIASVVIQASGMNSAAKSLPAIKDIISTYGVNKQLNFESFCQAANDCPDLMKVAKALLTYKPLSPAANASAKKGHKDKTVIQGEILITFSQHK